MTQIEVPLGARSYSVQVGEGLLASLGEQVREVAKPAKIMLVTDTNVEKYGYATIAEQSLMGAGIACKRFVLQAGEHSKNMQNASNLLEECAKQQLTGGDLLVAVGGGVVGDITGFVAAIYRRGTAFVQVPTTLLAMVDASVGGKTAVNLSAGKNLAGAFWQPKRVLCSLDTLKTLSQEEYSSGIAECIKYAVLWDESLFAALEVGALFKVTEAQIARCIQLKCNVVSQDERDVGERRLLNLGHTIGHAIEQVSNYQIAHGAAVGLGMLHIFDLFLPEELGKLARALQANHLPTTTNYTPQQLFSALAQDKKREGDSITLVRPLAIGSCKLESMRLTEWLERMENK